MSEQLTKEEKGGGQSRGKVVIIAHDSVKNGDIYLETGHISPDYLTSPKSESYLDLHRSEFIDRALYYDAKTIEGVAMSLLCSENAANTHGTVSKMEESLEDMKKLDFASSSMAGKCGRHQDWCKTTTMVIAFSKVVGNIRIVVQLTMQIPGGDAMVVKAAEAIREHHLGAVVEPLKVLK